MKAFAIGTSFVLGMMLATGCSSEVDDDPLSSEGAPELRDEEAVGSTQQSITKGSVGAVNGAADYCNTVNRCVQGEGDCDSNAQCNAGLICAADNGPKFGFPAGWDVCVPSHCTNKTMDGDETGADCGGSCGTCSSCVGVPGASTFCNGCQCGSGQGDCDSNAECASGLTCATDNGPLFGLPTGYDVCVPPHCLNGVLDAASGETGVDDGGPCGTHASTCTGTAGTATYCVGCLCASGEGDCDSDAECASGLVCGANIGSKFGLPAGHDICVPAHCTNKVLDAASGETGIDVGGPCGAAPPACGDGVVNGSEVCDDGINDGVVCSPGCTGAVEVAQILFNCDSGSGVAASLAGTGCISFPNAGASYILFQSGGASVTLYLNSDCTGESLNTTTDRNFCGTAFDQGSNMNDNVRSAKIQHL